MATEEQKLIEDEATELSLQDIYQQLIVTSELILRIPAEEEIPLRKGLAMVKSKQNTKLKDSGIQPDRNTLKFDIVPVKGNEDIIDVHISLSPRAGITVISMKTPDPSF